MLAAIHNVAFAAGAWFFVTTRIKAFGKRVSPPARPVVFRISRLNPPDQVQRMETSAHPARSLLPAGLSEAEASARLRRLGANALPRAQGRSLFDIVQETAREPMFLLMLGGAALYLLLGDLIEGLFLIVAACVAIGLIIFQDSRSERALTALRALATPQVRVIRDGFVKRIPASDLVPDDIVLIGEGDRVMADCLYLEGDSLSVDESALTGESAPVTKHPAKTHEDFGGETEQGAPESPFLFSGTLIVGGQGRGIVRRTGPASALGKIGASLSAISSEPTHLQKSSHQLIRLIGLVALIVCIAVVLAHGLLRGDWIGGLLAGITVGIALVPEEFPMVLAVFMALGAWRLASHRVLVRRSAAVETLGAVSALCVDKTGTLTQNKMRLQRLWTGEGAFDFASGDTPESVQALLLSARRASTDQGSDPMDAAIAERVVAPPSGTLDSSWPLRPELLAVMQVWRLPDGDCIAAAKGAPEAIFRLCGLNETSRAEIETAVSMFASQGLRVLGAAEAQLAPDFQGDPIHAAFCFSGLLSFADPLRSDVAHALEEARGAGIKIVMITGDHPATALAIARDAGMDTAAGVLTGKELAALSDEDLNARADHLRVFARISPQQKLRLVEAFKSKGDVVAMTGDGVNDAPALEAAHVGISMGRRGTDVAREASDIILLDDSFVSIVGGIRLGRRIFRNLRQALIYITAIHVPIAGIALLPLLAGLPPVLFPMHVVLLELAIDPICALVFEAERSEAGAMKRPPRPMSEPWFGWPQIRTALLQGGGLLAGVLGLYGLALQMYTAEQARAGAFLALASGNLALAYADSRSTGGLFARHRVAFLIVAGLVALLLSVIMLVPAAQTLFAIARPPGALVASALAVALAAGLWTFWLRRA